MKVRLFTYFCYNCHAVFLLTNIAININIVCLRPFLSLVLQFLYLFGSFVSWQKKTYSLTHLNDNKYINHKSNDDNVNKSNTQK